MMASHVFNVLDSSIPISIDFIIFAMVVERAVGLLLPTEFHKINKSSIVWSVNMVALLIPLAIYSPLSFQYDIFYNNNTGFYQTSKTWFGKLEFMTAYYPRILDGFIYIDLLLLISASAVAIIGLRQTIRKKKYLPATMAFITPSEKYQLQVIEEHNQLIRLQICEAIPAAVNAILMGRNLLIFSETNPLKLVQMAYADAERNVSISIAKVWIGIIQGIAFLFSHGMHIFRYVAFSAKVRKALKSILPGQNKINVSINVQVVTSQNI